MKRWTAGEAEIEALITTRKLQRLRGGQTNAQPLLQRAERTLATAAAIVDDDADSAYVLAYDAVRHAGTALLAQQGLRPTTEGGHYAVEVALRAQFGNNFRPFGTMRRRRNELEYPSGPGETTTIGEAREAVENARRLYDAASQLLPVLGLF